MVGHRPSHNVIRAGLPGRGLPGILPEGFVALRLAVGTNGPGYSTTTTTTTTTMRWHMPVALRGGGLD